MSKIIYFLVAIASFYLFYNCNKPNQNNSNLLFETKKNKSYKAVVDNKRGNIVGTYYTTKGNNKELILDSTYTYAYTFVNEENKEITLEGFWELSYKGEKQHIVLHAPINAKNKSTSPYVEHLFKVNKEGLTDTKGLDSYIKIKDNKYSLAFIEE